MRKLLSKLLSWYHSYPSTKYPVKYAFTVAGVDYYCFDDLFNLPYQRALKALAAYEEVRMKCTYEYLKWHTNAMDTLIQGMAGKDKVVVNLAALSQRNNHLKQRLEQWVIDLNHVYRLASIVFFDKNENPTDYDFTHGNKKIEHWKKHQTMDVFFSSVAIQTLIPFLKSLNQNFQNYSEVLKKLETMDLKNLSGSLSGKQREDFTKWLSRSYAQEITLN